MLLTCWAGLNGVELEMPWVPWKIPDEIPPPEKRYKGQRTVTPVNLWEVWLGYIQHCRIDDRRLRGGGDLLSNLTPSAGGSLGLRGRLARFMTDNTGGKVCCLPATRASFSPSTFLHTRFPLYFLVHWAKLLKFYRKMHRPSKNTSTRGRKRLKTNFVTLLREDQIFNEPHWLTFWILMLMLLTGNRSWGKTISDPSVTV